MKSKILFYHIGIILFFVIILIIPFMIISNYVHETAHVRAADKLNVNLTISSIFEFENYYKFGMGKAMPKSKNDCEIFNSLPLESKKKITHAGVKAQLIIFLPLLLFLIFLVSLKKTNFYSLQILSVIIALLFSLIITSAYSNVLSPNPMNDWNILFLNCSNFK